MASSNVPISLTPVQLMGSLLLIQSLEVKSVADELALIDAPLSDDDLTIFALNGLGNGFKEISAAIRARDNSISFEELHDKLVEHEDLTMGAPLIHGQNKNDVYEWPWTSTEKQPMLSSKQAYVSVKISLLLVEFFIFFFKIIYYLFNLVSL
ncbi:hypothetical protein Pint_22381 [Pistacia integerrima]|uniref:Uncharacterized protein n=1 Tax=Pistacia integerrima TaxID=434235 RepID=A0ACC0YKD9_9ROSI|nr:hypothetical protein Pint_22381 [Pistacia integerrima]